MTALGRRCLRILAWAMLAATQLGSAATWDVAIQNFSFVPNNLEVSVGDTVTWTQKDSSMHTSTSGANGVADSLWDSGPLTLTGTKTFSYTFTKEGTFPYFCKPHSVGMRATVVVKAPATPPSVTLTGPTGGSALVEPAQLVLTAAVTPGSSPVAMVSFLSGTNVIGERMEAPFTLTVSNLAAGSYSFTAEVMDTGGLAATSTPVTVTVGKAATGKTWDVSIQGFKFVPASLEIAVGDTVVWTQKDTAGHTSTSGANGVADGLWDSGLLTLTGTTTFSRTFTTAGTFPYFCKPHAAGMRATIVVKAPATPPSITLSGPAGGTALVEPAQVQLAAAVTAGTSPVAAVSFFSGTNKLGEVTQAPYLLVVSNLAAGSYSFTAQVVDAGGLTSTSSPVAVSVAPAPTGKTWDVAIQGFKFVPANLEISVGDRVVWTQKDSAGHTTTSGTNAVADGLWDSGMLTLTGTTTFSYTFTNAGTFAYFCKPHSANMRATIVVKAKAATITEVASVGSLGLKLAWKDGTPPFLVQKSDSVTGTNWIDVVTTSDSQMIVARDDDASFFRVVSAASGNVTPFTVLMNGASEKPDSVDTPATAFGSLSLSGNRLNVHVRFSGLSAPATAAHIHGLASTTNAAGVLVPLVVPAATSGIISGTYDVSTLTQAQIDGLKAGQTYLNIHTANHKPGEIRGQVAPLLLEAALDGASERPTPVVTTASGYGDFWLIGNEITYDVDYTGLAATATAAHIHGPAGPDAAAGVMVPLVKEGNLGTSGAFSGTAQLTAAQLAAVVDGLTYVNVHDASHPAGEIRGQLKP